MKNKEDNNESAKKNITTSQNLFLFAASGIILVIWVANWSLIGNPTGRGTIGDMFGVCSSLFTALSFMGVIYAIVLQRNQMTLQQEEINDAKIDSKIEKFENTFFNMLHLHNENLKNLELDGKLHGRQVTKEAHNHLYASLSYDNYAKLYNAYPTDDEIILLDNPDISNVRAVLNGGAYFDKYYDRFVHNLNHYFRYLYHIFKFIYFSGLEKEEKKFYASIVRAQLSQSDLYIIAFNSVIEYYGYPKFTYLIREFNILENFDWEKVTPDIYKQLIKYDIENVQYPFEESKPKNTIF